MQSYKPTTVEEQVEYLHQNMRVQFNEIDKKTMENILLYNNYVNVITPFKHYFAKKDNKREVLKDGHGCYIYVYDVDFHDYYEKFKNERLKYPIIAINVIAYESHFKAILAYRILTNNKIESSDDLFEFLDKIRLCAVYKNNFSKERNRHINKSILDLEETIDNFTDVYCFFDRLSLGISLNLFLELTDDLQDLIFTDISKLEMNFNVRNVSDYISKVFTLVSIRNCVMHCNSLEILIRFYNPKNHQIRRNRNKRIFVKMIDYLSTEKQYTPL